MFNNPFFRQSWCIFNYIMYIYNMYDACLWQQQTCLIFRNKLNLFLSNNICYKVRTSANTWQDACNKTSNGSSFDHCINSIHVSCFCYMITIVFNIRKKNNELAFWSNKHHTKSKTPTHAYTCKQLKHSEGWLTWKEKEPNNVYAFSIPRTTARSTLGKNELITM